MPESVLHAGAGSLIEPATLMSIKSLELRAKIVVEGLWKGIHRSPLHGFSVEFTEYRQYATGDDLRFLDWRLYARTDRDYLKKFEDETSLRCFLLMDNSRSMHYGSLSYTKAQYAHTLAATLAYFLFLQGDAVGLLTFDETIRDYLPARNRSGHLRQLMLALERPTQGKSTNFLEPLQRIAELVRKRSLIVLCSDFLAPPESFAKNLRWLAGAGHELILFHFSDPAELNFQFAEPILFEDAETGRRIYIDPSTARAEYLKKRQAHLDTVRRMADQLGAAWISIATDVPLSNALGDFLRDRQKRGKKIRRSRALPIGMEVPAT